MNANNQLAPRGDEPQTFSKFITGEKVSATLKQSLGEKDGNRFISSIISAVATNPGLQKCEQSTIISAALLGEALKLSPSPQLGQYYLVPFEDRKNGRTVATFVLGYKGYIQLAIRSGQYADLDVIEIREGEYLGRDKRTGKFLFEFIENEAERISKPVIGYMGYFELCNGFKKTLYVSKERMEAHADQFSKAFNLADYKRLKEGEIAEKDMWKYSSFWYKDFDAMAFKTILRQLISKWGIMSIDMQRAFESESGDYVSEDTNIDFSSTSIPEYSVISEEKQISLDDIN